MSGNLKQGNLFGGRSIEGLPKIKRLWVSVSGGKTSMMMARLIQQELGATTELLFLFANTGQEHPKTLEFVDRCDKKWGLNVVWLEAVVHAGRVGTTHKLVNFETASRNGNPFSEVIGKFGIPNKNFPHCNRELKLRPLQHYIKEIGWKDAMVAVGIRADEPKRIRAAAQSEGIVYPFAHWWAHDKQDVISWWDDQPFNLEILEREGNCTWCWKKSLRKHAANISENPHWYDFPRAMEDKHGMTNRENRQVFFRGAMSTDDLFVAVSEINKMRVDSDEESGGCSESCEAFACETGSI